MSIRSSDYHQADLTFLLGASFSDPDNAAAVAVGRLVIAANFDRLAAPKPNSPAYAETFVRGIENEAGRPFWLTVRVDD